jgi:CIC family chloride channel protein
MQPALPIQLALNLTALPSVEELLIFVPLYLLLGAVMGICGAAFNTALLFILRLVDRWRRPTKLIMVAVFGAGVGALLAVAPEFVGGGEALIEAIIPNSPAIPMLLLLLAVRAVLTFASYATGPPGGIFAPLLALGTLIGMGFALGVQALFPQITIHAGAFGIAAMGGLFAASVRAPLTGIVLVSELTGRFGLLSAMVPTCLTASITAQSLGSKPIYDLLLARTLDNTDPLWPQDDERLEKTIRG